MAVERLKARVRNGRLVMDEPTDWPEGTEFVILDLDVVNDEMTDEDRAELERQLDESEEDIKAGRTIPASVFLANLEADSLQRRSRSRPAPTPKAAAPTNGGKRTVRRRRTSFKKS